MTKAMVESLDLFGQGIVKEAGKVFFVKNALPQEEIDFTILKSKKNVGFGVAKKILTPSKHRQTAPCPYYGVCGGCQFQHCDDETEIAAKENHVLSTLKRIGGWDTIPFQTMDGGGDFYGYRNKVTWQIQGGQTGFFRENSNSFLAVDHCLLLEEPLNEVTKVMNRLALKGLHSIILRCNEKGEVAVTLQGKVAKGIGDSILAACPGVISVNTEVENSMEKDFLLSLGERHFLASPQSFFQVNTKAAAAMLDYVKVLLGAYERQYLLDLYCGVGTIGICLGDLFKKVYGVDSYQEAITFAKKNARRNGIKAEYRAARAEDHPAAFLHSIPKMDCIVIDPPRKGLHPEITEALCNYKAESLLYISCDPGTLSRDLKTLKSNYDLKVAKPFNLFPRTAHCETVALMSRVEK